MHNSFLSLQPFIPDPFLFSFFSLFLFFFLLSSISDFDNLWQVPFNMRFKELYLVLGPQMVLDGDVLID